MTAKEYYNSTRLVATNNWTLGMVFSFAEEYSKWILKQTTTPILSEIEQNILEHKKQAE